MLLAPELGLGLVVLTNAESYVAEGARWEAPKNAFRLMLGQPVVERSWIDASVGALLGGMAFCGIAAIWFVHGAANLILRVRTRSLLRGALSVAFGFGVALGFFADAPRAFDAPLSSILLTTPDAGWMFVAASALSLLGGATNAAAWFIGRK
jgi:hypothetical protein